MDTKSRGFDRYRSIFFGGVICAGLCLASWYNYLLFHSLAEMFSIVVACGMFMIVWNTRQFMDHPYLQFLGVAYLFIGGLDGVHMLAYKGLPIFPGYDANLPTQLWIAARYLESLSLLIAPVFFTCKLRTKTIFASYSGIVIALLAATFARIFPDCFVEGVGLTPFKILSEYVICGLLVAAIIILHYQRQKFDPPILRLVIASLVVTIGAELAFTRYISVYGPANLIGHLLKILSFYLLYKAIIETGLRQPYRLLFRDLTQQNERLEAEIVERKRVEADLSLRSQELARSNADLEQFAYVASHDLQEPLRMVASYLQLLEKRYWDKLDADANDFIGFAVDGARRMQMLISDLLAYSRIGTRNQPFQPINCEQVLEKAMINLHIAIQESGAHITHSPLPSVWGDATQLTQLFQNLIGNAIKFRSDRPPEICICAEPDEDCWRFSIQDNGLGIEPQYFTRIFMIFQRLHSRGAYPGTGIGLAICKKIVERHGGAIRLESEPGQGTTFYFMIPKKGDQL